MAAYLVVDVVDLTDPETYERYKPLMPPTLARYGGQYLARGGRVQVLEGEWSPARVVLVRFRDAADALRWWRSPEYAAAQAIRQKATKTGMVVVDGMPDVP